MSSLAPKRPSVDDERDAEQPSKKMAVDQSDAEDLAERRRAVRRGRFVISENDSDDSDTEPEASALPDANAGQAAVDPFASGKTLPDELPPQRRVVAIGDVHGDVEALRQCLRISECASFDERGGARWSAPPGTAVVVLGDVVDRFRAGNSQIAHEVDAATGLTKSLGEGPDDEAVALALLNSLAEQAAALGCWLYRLVGNHEYMQADPTDTNFSYAASYASPFSMGGAAPSDLRRRHDSFARGRMHDLVGATHPKVAVKIGPHVFCHGGFNVPCIRAAEGRPIIPLANAAFDDAWFGRSRPESARVFRTIVNGCGRSRGGSDLWSGVLWDDTLSGTQKKESACYLDAEIILRELDSNMRSPVPVKHLVVSHCIQLHREGESAGMRPARTVPRPDLGATDFTTIGVPPGEPRFLPSDPLNRTINTLCDGTVWRVDVGMSRAFAFASEIANAFPYAKPSSRPAVLIIENRDGAAPEYTVRQLDGALY